MRPVTHLARLGVWAWLIAVFAPCVSRAETAFSVESQNFLITAPTAELAQECLESAETYRQEIAKCWLGEELPPSVGRTVIRLKLSDTEDEALSLLADSRERLSHCVWLTASLSGMRTALAHELAHVVLATRYPGEVPAWVHEGIAGSYDGPKRQATRNGILAWFSRTNNWPQLERLLQAAGISRQDMASYSAAVSLSEFLLTRGDRSRLVEFALAGHEQGWDAALQRHYQIQDVAQLQEMWQPWVTAQIRKANASERIAALGTIHAQARLPQPAVRE